MGRSEAIFIAAATTQDTIAPSDQRPPASTAGISWMRAARQSSSPCIAV